MITMRAIRISLNKQPMQGLNDIEVSVIYVNNLVF